MRPLTSTQCGAKSTLYLMRDQSDLQQKKIRKNSELKKIGQIQIEKNLTGRSNTIMARLLLRHYRMATTGWLPCT